jgi:hypothetical protein
MSGAGSSPGWLKLRIAIAPFAFLFRFQNGAAGSAGQRAPGEKIKCGGNTSSGTLQTIGKLFTLGEAPSHDPLLNEYNLPRARDY